MVIFLDSGSIAAIEKYASHPRIAGFITNPSLLREAGISSYRAFAKTVLGIVGDRDVSFDVLAGDESEMYRQAMEIASLGENIYVKIPVTYIDGTLTEPLLVRLEKAGVKLNITAILINRHGMNTVYALADDHIISVSAGAIMDTGINGEKNVWHLRKFRKPKMRILWADAKEAYNVRQAERCADIIALPPDLIDKLELRGKHPREYSLEIVRQLHEDKKGIEF